METLEGLAYDAALRALDKQEHVLDEIRSRTSVLLATASLAVSFLGRTAFDRGTPVSVAAAVAAFSTAVGASLYVLVPRRRFVFATSGPQVFEGLFPFRDDTVEIARRLAYELDRFRVENDRALAVLKAWLAAAAVAVELEIGLLVAAVGGTIHR